MAPVYLDSGPYGFALLGLAHELRQMGWARAWSNTVGKATQNLVLEYPASNCDHILFIRCFGAALDLEAVVI
jgi:hypothetical protein